MAGDFDFIQCSGCGLKGNLVVRSSRYVTKFYKESYLKCKNCGARSKGRQWVGHPIWPSRKSDEAEIREEFKSWIVRENHADIKGEFLFRMDNAKAEVEKLEKQLIAAKDEIAHIQNTYDLLLDIGFGKESKAS
ncbi:ogr/Delta-like zinc finger family protein [Chromobacterium violaceum]|uniref:ogr/Delta-like zinc finger family protein n=1 Tax=Chromobacterium violaceum TaxID=536 RepID=UPI0015FB4738|nr:ogr/Delta-like zinc finger family protein [Chromobacterium violaceum]MBA8733997.1 ogr/Delta-like zinc finger family protein [Chromobacterium violaceum]